MYSRLLDGFAGDERRMPPVLSRLAATYAAQGRNTEAASCLKRSVAILERSAQPGAPELSEALRELAAIYRAEGRSERAKEVTNKPGFSAGQP
jgi:tetratricopeptide (TPR) repeat protein